MSIAEKREARKRRILENLDKRMQKITGISNSLDDNETNMDEPNFFTSTPLLCNEKEDIGDIFQSTDNIETSPPFSFKLSEDVTLNKKDSSSIKKILFNAELQIIVTAFLAFSLLYFNAGFLLYENLMVPFYTLQIVQISLGKNNLTSNVANILITVLGMYGFSNSMITAIAKLMMLLFNMGKDLCLYIFVIILLANII